MSSQDFARLVALNSLDRLHRETKLARGEKNGLTAVQYYSVALTFTLWFPIFFIGTYDVIPWVLLFTVLLMNLSLCLASALQRRWIFNRVWTTLLSVFLVGIFGLLLASNSRTVDVIGGVIAICLAGIAVILLSKHFAPEFILENSWTPYLQVGIVLGGVLAFAYCLGQFNDKFLTCNDYNNAGERRR